MHRFVLKKCRGKRDKLVCPSCKDPRRTFSPYIDTEAGDAVLAAHVGMCDRANNCGYHYPPKQFFADNPDHKKPTFTKVAVPSPKPVLQRPMYISKDIFQASLRPGRSVKEIADKNEFIAFLLSSFGTKIASHLVDLYHIGSSRHRNNATVFWLVDENGKIRSGKIIQFLRRAGNTFSGENCKRNKESDAAWVHWILYGKKFNLYRCLFGQHLLNRWPEKKIAIVESEKTAIVASIYLPQFIWMAAGSLNYLSAELCKCLAGRQVILFPDLKGFERWDTKRKEISAFCQCIISSLLEDNASQEDKDAGLDLADYLLQFSPEEFANESGLAVPAEPAIEISAKSVESVVVGKEIIPSEIRTRQNSIEETVPGSIQPGMQIDAFVDESGHLFIKTPTTDTYSVYPGVCEYNDRTCLPRFEPARNFDESNKLRVFINTTTLIVSYDQ